MPARAGELKKETMYKGYRYIDSDSHILEPEDIWERYLEPEFREEAPRTVAHWISAAEHGLQEEIETNL